MVIRGLLSEELEHLSINFKVINSDVFNFFAGLSINMLFGGFLESITFFLCGFTFIILSGTKCIHMGQ